MGQNEAKPSPIVYSRFPIDRDMVDIGDLEPGFPQTIIDRLRRQTGPMFDPAKPLLFRGSNDLAIDDQTSRGISVISVKTQDCHLKC
jgi:hypothetical protein